MEAKEIRAEILQVLEELGMAISPITLTAIVVKRLELPNDKAIRGVLAELVDKGVLKLTLDRKVRLKS